MWIDSISYRIAGNFRAGENFREVSKKTNFAKKTFANHPKEILQGRRISRIGKAAIIYVAISSMCVDEMETYILETVVRGYRAYKELWELALSPCLQL